MAYYTTRDVETSQKESVRFSDIDLNFELNIHGNKIKDFSDFADIKLNLKIREGLIDIDETNFQWKDFADFKITDSLIFVKEGNETFITEIIDVFETEIVISIKDKSVHSIVLKDKEQVTKFTDFMQSIIEKKAKIIGTSTNEGLVEIFKEELN